MPGNVNHSLHAPTEMQEPANPATLIFFPVVCLSPPIPFLAVMIFSSGEMKGEKEGGEPLNSRSSLIAFQDRTTPFVFP